MDDDEVKEKALDMGEGGIVLETEQNLATEANEIKDTKLNELPSEADDDESTTKSP